MVEQANAGEAHDHVVAVAGLDDVVIPDTAAGLCDILHAAAECSLNVIAEGEERVGAESHIGISVEPCPLLLCSKYSGLLCEECFPLAVRKNIHVILAHVQVDGVVSVGSADALLEGKSEHLGRLAQIPVVGLAAGKSRAVDPGLLSGADADSLSALYIAYGVGLCVLKSDQRDRHIVAGRLRKLFVLCHDVCKQRIVDDQFISARLEGNAEHLLLLESGRLIVGVDLQDAVIALFLLSEDLKCFRLIVGSDDTVRDLSG